MSFTEGERVFAKLSTWPYWPARINKLPNYITIPSGTYPIFFYGTHEVNFLSPKMILPFEENKVKFSRNKRYQYYTEAMWEIEHNSDVLSIDKDDTAEDFLCDAYNVVKPIISVLQIPSNKNEHNGKNDVRSDDVVEPLVLNPEIHSSDLLTSDASSKYEGQKLVEDTSKITVVLTEKSVIKAENDLKIKVVPKKENLFDNLEFSDDDSEDMTSLYSKLIIIAGYQDSIPEKPDSSTGNHEADALVNDLISEQIKPCWVLMEKMSQVDINKALNITSRCEPSLKLQKKQCVSTLNEMSKTNEIISIDSDDNSIIITPTKKISLVTENKVSENKISEIMPKNKQTNVSKCPKPLFEKYRDNYQHDKVTNILPVKKSSSKSKTKIEKKEKPDVSNQINADVPPSFDNLFKKKFTILGSGMKIGKKSSNSMSIANNEKERVANELKDVVIDLVFESDDIGRSVGKKRKIFEDEKDLHLENQPGCVVKIIDDKDVNAQKRCKMQSFREDIIIQDKEIVMEKDIIDVDDKHNSSKNKTSTKSIASINKIVIEIEDDPEDVQILQVPVVIENKHPENYQVSEDSMEDNDVEVITCEEGYERNGDYEKYYKEGYEEDSEEVFHNGYKWPPIEPEECYGRDNWFDVDKYSHYDSPPRYADLVKKKVVQSPDMEPIHSDRFYHLWTDCNPNQKIRNHQKSLYANRFHSPYKNRIHSLFNYENMLPQREPRMSERYKNYLKYCDTDYPSETRKKTEKSMDVWRRHIESKTRRQHSMIQSEYNFMSQINRYSEKQCIDLTQNFHSKYSGYPNPIDNGYDIRSMYHSYPYPYPDHIPMSYPYSRNERFYNGYRDRMFMHNMPNIPYTPESPDSDMMEDSDNYEINRNKIFTNDDEFTMSVNRNSLKEKCNNTTLHPNSLRFGDSKGNYSEGKNYKRKDDIHQNCGRQLPESSHEEVLLLSPEYGQISSPEYNPGSSPKYNQRSTFNYKKCSLHNDSINSLPGQEPEPSLNLVQSIIQDSVIRSLTPEDKSLQDYNNESSSCYKDVESLENVQTSSSNFLESSSDELRELNSDNVQLILPNEVMTSGIIPTRDNNKDVSLDCNEGSSSDIDPRLPLFTDQSILSNHILKSLTSEQMSEQRFIKISLTDYKKDLSTDGIRELEVGNVQVSSRDKVKTILVDKVQKILPDSVLRSSVSEDVNSQDSSVSSIHPVSKSSDSDLIT